MRFGKQLADVSNTLGRLEEKISKSADQQLSQDAFAVRAERDEDIFDTSDGIYELLSGSETQHPDISRIHTKILEDILDPGWKPEEHPIHPCIDVRAAVQQVTCRLQFHEYHMREAAVSDSVLNTYSWIFGPPPASEDGHPAWGDFPAWLEASSASRYYWITGKPGSGKSTLMKYVLKSPALITHLRRWAGETELLVVSYYAWNAGTTLQKSIDGLKRTLLIKALTQFPDIFPIISPRRWAGQNLLCSTAFVTTHPHAETESMFSQLLSICGDKISLAIFIDGLDEFDLTPNEVVTFVESISASAQRGVKVCVASRPWVEFEDAYADTPKLHMDRHTTKDMHIYISEAFRTCRAFRDIENASPAEADNLRRSIVEKASGVFIWVKLVTQALVQSAAEGAGLFELQAVLETMPRDIRKLYDAIWASIPDHNRRRGALLIQLVHFMNAPDIDSLLSAAVAWLADEYAFRTDELMHDLPDNLFEGSLFSVQLKRKLASRTRGLLEMVPQPKELGQAAVSFTHRSAYEWVNQTEVQDSILRLCGADFCPALFLLQILSALAGWRKFNARMSRKMQWDKLYQPALLSARKAACGLSGPSKKETLIRTLDNMDARVQRLAIDLLGLAQDHWSTFYLRDRVSPRDHVSLLLRKQQNTFINLAAQFTILPYLESKISSGGFDSFDTRATPKRIGILESMIFGYIYFLDGEPHLSRYDGLGHTKYPTFFSTENLTPSIRLKGIRLLLDYGVEQHKVYLGSGAVALKLRAYIHYILEIGMGPIAAGTDCQYFAEVLKLLGSNPLMIAVRSASMWIRSRKIKVSTEHRISKASHLSGSPDSDASSSPSSDVETENRPTPPTMEQHRMRTLGLATGSRT